MPVAGWSHLRAQRSHINRIRSFEGRLVLQMLRTKRPLSTMQALLGIPEDEVCRWQTKEGFIPADPDARLHQIGDYLLYDARGFCRTPGAAIRLLRGDLPGELLLATTSNIHSSLSAAAMRCRGALHVRVIMCRALAQSSVRV